MINFVKNSIYRQDYNKYLYSLIAGAFSGLSFAPVFLFPILFITFPLFYFLITKSEAKKEAYFIGFFFGFGHFITGLYWISYALFFDINQFWFLFPFALVGIPAAIAILYIGPFALIMSFIKINHFSRIIIFSILWVVFELARNYFFSGFPWNLLGYSLCFNDEIVQLASVTGIWGLSLVVIFSSSLVYLMFESKKNTKKVILFLIALYGGLYLFGSLKIKFSQLEIIPQTSLRIVQANIKQELRWSQNRATKNLETYINLSNKNKKTIPDIIIWPEGGLEFAVSINHKLPFLENIFDSKTFLVTGAERMQKHGTEFEVWNSLVAINNEGRIVDYYDKVHLVPYGEYVPMRSILKFNKITKGFRDLSRGKGPKSITLSKDIPSFSPIICYEVIFADQPIIKGKNAPKWLLNITNDAWYGITSGPYQHFHKSRIRAIEQGIPLVRSAGTGISGIIDSNGKVIAKLALNTEGVIDAILPAPLLNKTIYNQYGEKIIYLFLAFLALFAVLFKKFKKS